MQTAVREHNYIRIYTFIFILAGNKDNNKISDWFEFYKIQPLGHRS